jgi:hypothetical protein
MIVPDKHRRSGSRLEHVVHADVEKGRALVVGADRELGKGLEGLVGCNEKRANNISMRGGSIRKEREDREHTYF